MVLDMLYELMRKARPYIPFTGLNTVWRSLDKQGQSILDVGCGRGEPMRFINRHKQFYCLGADIFGPHLSEAKEQGSHTDYVLCDIRKQPIKEKTFDIVLCLEVLEHLSKEDGQKLLADMERIARRQVILSTPVGVSEQDEALLEEGNPFQIHKSGWHPTELKSLEYETRGSTIRCLGGKAGTISCPSKALRPLGYLLWVLTSSLAYCFPKIAADMICVRKLKLEDCDD